MGRITIQDISRVAGTSASTVSRVLNGSAVVSPEKREAVQRAIDSLHYRPNHIARSLKTSITYSVGLMLNDIMNPFYGAIARGAEDEASRHGYSLILCNTNEDADRELHYLNVLQDKNVDGIILGPGGEHAELMMDLSTRIPIVQVDRVVPGLTASAVTIDNFGATYEVTQMLIEKGHRRIGLIKWRKPINTLDEREAGYRQALMDAGIPYDPCLSAASELLNLQSSTTVTQALLTSENRPTALIALNNQLGLGVLAACQYLGLKMPDDIAVVVFDDAELFALFHPPITAVAQPAYEIGECAMQLLLKQMEEDSPVEQVVFPTRLIIRGSV